MFNGSASLRDAAGQLIENVCKSVRRKQTVDDAYYEKLYADVSALYRLDQTSRMSAQGDGSDLGPLPGASIALICALAAVWILLGLGALRAFLRARRNAK